MVYLTSASLTISLRVAGSSSTFSLNFIVDDGIVNDIVDEIVTCGSVLSSLGSLMESSDDGRPVLKHFEFFKSH